MSSTHSNLLYHVIFATKNRAALIDPAWRSRFHDYLGGVARGLGGLPKGIGGTADHIHMLILLKPTHCVADFVRELKKASSAWVKEHHPAVSFQWQEGYGVFTVSPPGAEAVIQYILNQDEHHTHRTYLEEYSAFLKKAGIEFNPAYLE